MTKEKYQAMLDANGTNDLNALVHHPRHIDELNSRAYRILEDAKKAIYETSLTGADAEWMRDLIKSSPELLRYLASDELRRVERRDSWMRNYYETAPEVILYGQCVKAWTDKYGLENSSGDNRDEDERFYKQNDRDHFAGRHNEGVLPDSTFGLGSGMKR